MIFLLLLFYITKWYDLEIDENQTKNKLFQKRKNHYNESKFYNKGKLASCNIYWPEIFMHHKIAWKSWEKKNKL